MELRRFTADDWPWVQTWFRDPVLDRELGPMDTDWLDAVLSETHGVQFVATIGGEPVALVGCVWARAPGEPHGITDLAVAPGRQRQGIGSAAIDLVLGWPHHPPCDHWIAFVSPSNHAAASFLASNGWRNGGTAGNAMIRFIKPSPSRP